MMVVVVNTHYFTQIFYQKYSKKLDWIRNKEGFIWFDGEGEFEPLADSWAIRAEEFEEAMANVEELQEEKGLWCDWLVQEVTGLLYRCQAWKEQQRTCQQEPHR